MKRFIKSTRDYTREQIKAWTNNNNIDPLAWDLSLTHHKTLVAEMDGIIVGFGDLNGNFWTDFMYMQSISEKELQLQLWTDWNHMQQSKIMQRL